MNKPLHRHLLAWAAVAALVGLAAPAQAQSAADGKRPSQRAAKAKAPAAKPKAPAAAAPAAAAVPAAAASAPAAAPSPADYIVAVVNTE
ncbi:MAG: hypothetical protein JSS18_02380, partial [Proteobacteria bacterium]|nr:hypothetical protein [Pseudomonadota bacterium]